MLTDHGHALNNVELACVPGPLVGDGDAGVTDVIGRLNNQKSDDDRKTKSPCASSRSDNSFSLDGAIESRMHVKFYSPYGGSLHKLRNPNPRNQLPFDLVESRVHLRYDPANLVFSEAGHSHFKVSISESENDIEPAIHNTGCPLRSHPLHVM